MADEAFPFGKPAGRLKDVPGALIVRDRTQLICVDMYGEPNPSGGHYVYPPMRPALAAFISAGRALGWHFWIADAHRTRERQAKKFADAVLKYGSRDKARAWVAPPESAPHCTGAAVDFAFAAFPKGAPPQISSEAAKAGVYQKMPAWQWFEANHPRYGFTRYAAEPWHLEFAVAGVA